MPILSKREAKAIYDAFLAVQPAKGKWVKLVRIPGPDGGSTYATFNEDARMAGLWLRASVSTDPHGNSRVQFGPPVLPELQEKARKAGYRVIIVDAPTGLALH